MNVRRTLKNQQGFTLIEIIAVLVLLGILAAVAVPKYLDLTDSAKNKAIDAGIAELNSRESVTWGNQKLAAAAPATDAAMDTAVLAAIDTNLGADYAWTAGPTATSGTLSFQSGTGVALTRTKATLAAPGTWKR